MTNTSKYKFPQWDPDDPIRREDFNDFAAKAEAALKDLSSTASAVSALSTTLANHTANCNTKMYFTSRRGGNRKTERFDIGYQPDIALIIGRNKAWVLWARGSAAPLMHGNTGTNTYNVMFGPTYIELGSTTTSDAIIPLFSDPNVEYFCFALKMM